MRKDRARRTYAGLVSKRAVSFCVAVVPYFGLSVASHCRGGAAEKTETPKHPLALSCSYRGTDGPTRTAVGMGIAPYEHCYSYRTDSPFDAPIKHHNHHVNPVRYEYIKPFGGTLPSIAALGRGAGAGVRCSFCWFCSFVLTYSDYSSR